MSIILERKTVEKRYLPSRNPQRRNPIYCKKISPIICNFCEEKVTSSLGRKKHFRTLNQLWAHYSFDHYNFDFKPEIMKLADQVIAGELV